MTRSPRLGARARRVLLIATALAACGGEVRPVGPPTYPEVVAARVERAQRAGVFEVRHNPSECACSPFEVRVVDAPAEGSPPPGVWHRVELVGVEENDPIIGAIAAHLQRLQASGARDRRIFRIEGGLDGRVMSCGKGAALLSLTPARLVEESR